MIIKLVLFNIKGKKRISLQKMKNAEVSLFLGYLTIILIW